MAANIFYLSKYMALVEKSKLEKIFFIFVFTGMLFFVAVTEQNNTSVAPQTAPGTEVSADQPKNQPEKPLDERYKYLGWWGEINYSKAGVYKEPTRNSDFLGTFSTDNRVKVLEEVKGEMVGTNELWYKIDGGMYPLAYVFSADVTPIAQPEPPAKPKIPASAKEGDYWIDVDLTKKVLSLFIYDKPIFATYVSTGVFSNPTLPGTYKIWYKIEKTRMRGRPPTAARVYDLKNVPFVMYYRGSFSLHGTYWHDKFGTRQSSGCTNLTQGDAKFIFERVNPQITDESRQYVFSTSGNPGTIVYNHY